MFESICETHPTTGRVSTLQATSGYDITVKNESTEYIIMDVVMMGAMKLLSHYLLN